MRKRTLRLSAAAAATLAFVVLWSSIAAKPWATTKRPAQDPRLLALTAREHRLRAEAIAVKRLVARRWHVYERRLRVRRRQVAAARRRHAEQLAAARAAARRIAAAQAAASSVSYAPAPAAPPAAAAPAAAPRIVTLPPRVQVVTLPPVTSSSSS
jgi:hypothetical protein